MPYHQLQTARTVLINISRTDRDFVFKMFSNDEVNKYLFDEPPFSTIQEADALIDFYTNCHQHDRHRWIITDKHSGEKLGTCGFHRYNEKTQSCEIGYDLYPTYQGRGYADEAITAMLEYIKNTLTLRSIVAHIYKDNLPSVRLVQKHDFVRSETTISYELNGTSYLHDVYVLTL